MSLQPVQLATGYKTFDLPQTAKELHVPQAIVLLSILFKQTYL